MDLIEKAKHLAEKYRHCVADLVAVLAEIDRLRLYAKKYHSLHEFCVVELLLTDDEAFRMIRSARIARTKPAVLSFLKDGSLTPRAVAILAPEKAAADFESLLDRARGKTVKQVEIMMAERRPDLTNHETTRVLRIEAASIVYRLSFNADETLKNLFDRLKQLLSHRHPSGDLEKILPDVIEDYLDRHDPMRHAARRRGTVAPGARRVPPAVRDEVWKRDGGRCTYAVSDRRCEATRFLELDHRIPWALGGRSDDPDNIRLLCSAHNQAEARRIFG